MPTPSACRPGDRVRPPPGDGQPPRQVVEDPADAALVQPRPGGDLGEREALSLELEQVPMRRRTEVLQQHPELIGLRDLAGSRLIRGGQPRLLLARERPLALDRAAVLTAAIDEMIVRHPG